MTRPLRDLQPVLAAQNNVVGRWQMTTSQIRAARLAVKNRDWQKPTNQVFAVGRGALTEEQRLWTALLHCGPDAQLAGRTALILNGWTEKLGAPFHVVTGRNVRRSNTPDWVIIHRALRLADSSRHPARVEVHKAAIQAAMWAPTDRAAMFIVLSCLQQRLVSAHRLPHLLPPRCHRRELIANLADEYLHGISSVNERDFAALCRGWNLPEPTRQSRVNDASGKPRAIDVEFRLSDGRIRRVEIEGMHHFEPDNFMTDIDRHNQLIVQGDVYLRVASFTVKYEPEKFRPVLTTWVQGQDLPIAS